METLIKAAWVSLIAVHVMSAIVLFAPSMTQSLYGVAPEGDTGVLIVHRGALFLAIIAAATFAVVSRAARRSATVIVGISVVGFLFVYVRAGLPAGALRTIAIADLIALVPLAFVSLHAWRVPGRPGLPADGN